MPYFGKNPMHKRLYQNQREDFYAHTMKLVNLTNMIDLMNVTQTITLLVDGRRKHLISHLI